MSEEKLERPAGYLEDENGNRSSMRLMCFISLFASIGWAALLRISEYQMNQYDIIIFMTFMVGAFAPKAIQKFAEDNCPPKK